MVLSVPARGAYDFQLPPGSSVYELTDAEAYRSHARVVDVRIQVAAPGRYAVKLIKANLHKLWLQEARTTLPHIGYYAIPKNRSVFFLLGYDHHAAIRHAGRELGPEQLVLDPLNSELHHRAPANAHWRSLSLTPEDLAAAGHAIIGRELASPSALQIARPPIHLLLRLRRLHQAAGHLAETAPDILAHPEVARAMEHALVEAMVQCVSASTIEEPKVRGHARTSVMRRFEQILEAHQGENLYLAEVCATVGVWERTLRWHCHQHLGVSPHKYLWLRRMNLARRALALADATSASVTAIATDHGFWELGQFAVAYRKLFGESPSVTLRRAPELQSSAHDRSPFDLTPSLS